MEHMQPPIALRALHKYYINWKRLEELARSGDSSPTDHDQLLDAEPSSNAPATQPLLQPCGQNHWRNGSDGTDSYSGHFLSF